VAVVQKNAEKHGTRAVAEGYLTFLYSPVGQRLAAKHFYRPVEPQYAEAGDLAQFADVRLFGIDEVFGGWAAAQQRHFDDGGVFDQIYQPK
jgi:sulfate transport system substrate-binding protein